MKKETKAQHFYKLATEAFEGYILKRDSFNGVFVCGSTNKPYKRKEVKVGYLYSPKDAPKIAFNEANAHVEYINAEETEERLYNLKLNIAFKLGNNQLTKVILGKKTKRWDIGRSIVELQKIIDTYRIKKEMLCHSIVSK